MNGPDNLSASSAAQTASPLPQTAPVFFPVSPLKLVVMSTVTFGLYEIYWFYKNWKLIKERTGRDIWPFWRALFGVLFCYSFFNEVDEAARSRGISVPSSPGLLATAWIILTISCRLPDPWWVVCWFTPFMLIPIQNTVNALNTVVTPGYDRNSRFSAWNIAATILGGSLVALSIIGSFLSN